MKKEAGDPDGPSQGGACKVSPASPDHETFFNLPEGKSPDNRPKRSVALLTASAAERAFIAAAGNQRPAGLSEQPWIKGRLLARGQSRLP